MRIKVEEKWVSKNGDELPLTQNGNVATLINYINNSDWTRVNIANEDYYYFYYNYKLAPNETTSELLNKVTFNPLITASISCQDNNQPGEIKKECYKDGNGYDGAKYTLKFTIETIQYNQYANAWGTTSVTISSESRPEPVKPAGQYLIENAINSSTVTSYNDTNADKEKMFAIMHNNITDYRYIGNVPNNYAYFNCSNPVQGQEYNYAASCGACNNDENKLSAVDKVGLMYASDYFMTLAGGVSDACYYKRSGECQQENAVASWIYSGNVREGQSEKSITLLISFPNIARDEVFTIREGGMYGDNYVDSAFTVRPTVCLKERVKISDGDGTINHPYVFEKMQDKIIV